MVGLKCAFLTGIKIQYHWNSLSSPSYMDIMGDMWKHTLSSVAHFIPILCMNLIENNCNLLLPFFHYWLSDTKFFRWVWTLWFWQIECHILVNEDGHIHGSNDNFEKFCCVIIAWARHSIGKKKKKIEIFPLCVERWSRSGLIVAWCLS